MIVRIQWILGVLFAILVGVGVLTWVDSTAGRGPTTGEAQKANALRVHLNDISFAITNYSQNHDLNSLEQVQEEGKIIGRLVNELSQIYSQKGKAEASKLVMKAHQGLREASVNFLAADQDAFSVKKELDAAGAAFESSLSVRGVSTNRRSEQARAHIDRYVQFTHKLQQAEGKKHHAADRLVLWREAFEKALRETPTESHQEEQSLILRTSCTLLLVIGMGLLLFLYLRSSRELARPLRDILQCIEAAAAGDTSRTPDYWSSDEVGRISQATGRLISVLARSENLVYHLASLVESSGDAIISHTLDGKILSWNKGAQRMYGYSAEEMKGRYIESLTEGEGEVEMKTSLKKLRTGEKLKPFETLHRAKNGRVVRALVRVAAIYDSTRQIIGASFIAQEIPAIKASTNPLTHQPTGL
jgi:PAS domain S-box-containing protein